MMPVETFGEQLSRRQAIGRAIALCAILGGAILLQHFDPNALPARVRGVFSCGAASGIPCLFCGLTRALHYLLNADFARAFYFNWLAFPLLIATVALAAGWICEIIVRRPLLARMFTFRITSRRLLVGCGALICLWTMQVALAVSHHKAELLNPAGPLYPFFLN